MYKTVRVYPHWRRERNRSGESITVDRSSTRAHQCARSTAAAGAERPERPHDMVRRTKEEAQATRNRVLDAAERVFYEKGVSRTTLADIAQAAGVTRGAIYWHFANKGDLFNAMFDRSLLPLDELVATTLDGKEEDPLTRLRELF